MKRNILALAAVLAVSAFCAAGEPLTVGKAVELALKNYPTIKQSFSDRDAAAARLRQKFAACWPSLEIEGVYARVEPDPTLAFGPLGTLQLYPEDNYDFHIGLSYTLLDLGRTGSQIDLSNEMLSQAQNAVELSKTMLSYQTIQLFYSVLFLSQQSDVQQKEIDSLTEYMSQTRKKVSFGSATDFDALTIQVKLEESKNAKADLDNAFKKTFLQFKKNIGAVSDPKLEGKFFQDKLNIDENSLIAKALVSRPECVMTKQGEQIARAQLSVANNSDNPALFVGGTFGYKNGFLMDIYTLQNNWVLTAGVKIPLFDGGRTAGMEAEARSSLASAEFKSMDVEESVKTEVRQAISDVNTGYEKLRAAGLHVKLAEEAMSQANVRFDNGVITNLDLINSETSLARARLFFSQAQYAYVMSVFSLKRAAGVKIWQELK